MYDTCYRSDVVWEAWLRVRKNTGAPGVDGQTLEPIEQVIGGVPFLKARQEELRPQTYEPEAVLRHWIPTPGTTKQRPRGIPGVKDRMAHTAATLVLEPMFRDELFECLAWVSSRTERPRRHRRDSAGGDVRASVHRD